MKRTIIFFSFILIQHGFSQNEMPTIEGPYLGQEPPGVVAIPFAPGIISKEGWELDGVFAPGMTEFYFTMNQGKGDDFIPMIIGLRLENGTWKKFIEFKRHGEITFSPDGNRMYMAGGYRDRVDKGWTERQSLGEMFNHENLRIMRLSVSSNGTYFFDEFKRDYSGDIRYSSLIDGKYSTPKKLPNHINQGKSFHPFIAPDESYLLFDGRREGGFGNSDIYITYRKKDGSWSNAINLGQSINTDAWEASGSVTPDGKFLFFNRNMGSDSYENVDIFWVDAGIIDDLRPDNL